MDSGILPTRSPVSLLHFPILSHLKSSSNAISLLKLQPTSKTNNYNALNSEPDISTHKSRSEEGQFKWGLNTNHNHYRIVANSSTAQEMYTQILRQFVESEKLSEAKYLYFMMKDKGLEPGIVLETMLVDHFMKSGQISEAFELFDRMRDRNVVTWTCMILNCVRNDHQEIVISLFVEMLESGIVPNDYAFNVMLQACADLAAVDIGKQVHSLVVKSGFDGDCRIENCLIDYYSKCRLIDEAQKVFSRMLNPDLVSFTSMIVGFCNNDLLESAVQLFDRMWRLGLFPNEHTITAILAVCDFVLGKQIHAYMVKTMLHQCLYSANALIEIYSNNNCIQSAKLVFEKLEARNVVTWSTMISCFLTNGFVDEAMELFCRMADSGIEPNEYTFATAIGACGLCSESISLGQQLHCLIIKRNLGSNDRIFNALLTMYARDGKVEELEQIFEKIQDPDIVSWCAAISGYSQNGYGEKSVSLLCLMHRKEAKPNEYAFSSALSSCANLALLDQGRQFHSFALKLGCDFDVCVGNALVNMYAKCGNIGAARVAFDSMPNHDAMSWNTLIQGYAYHGLGRMALQIFDEMVELGHVMPDHATFVGVLTACSHVGLVEEAFGYFKIMNTHYGIPPSISHYTCMIDMMGRAGRLNDAAQIIFQMPFEPDSLIWKTLLGSCRLHKNLELGKLVGERAIELSPQDSANYVLLSNLHATCGEQVEAERMRKMMEERGVKKDAGWSWIEIGSEVHSFVAGDRSHPRTQAIYKMLEELLIEMTKEGYSPDRGFVLHDL